MKILSSTQIRELDAYTITHEPISSIDLMERASWMFTHKVREYIADTKKQRILVFCGPGNNGGDALAVARQLNSLGYEVNVFALDAGHVSADQQTNVQRLKMTLPLHLIHGEDSFPLLNATDIVIDGIFGSGLSRSPDEVTSSLIRYINASGAKIFSIDIPSGMYPDIPNEENDAVIQAYRTFTFHAPKLSFFLPSNKGNAGDFEILDIGLHHAGDAQMRSIHHYLEPVMLRKHMGSRLRSGHKNSFGHVCICAGTYGMAGAAVMAVKAALRSGAGLVTAQIPFELLPIMQMQNPEALTIADKGEKHIHTLVDYASYQSLGIGPGIGVHPLTVKWLEALLLAYRKPMVLDADALNILASHSQLLHHIPKGSILTPHPGEFRRLFGLQGNDLDRLERGREMAAGLGCVIVLKGAYTAIIDTEGEVHFNSTGNSGMAKGGSGDVLTGLITGLLAQGYPSLDAACLGVYIHGLAGDAAARSKTEYAMTPLDIVEHLGDAWKSLLGESAVHS